MFLSTSCKHSDLTFLKSNFVYFFGPAGSSLLQGLFSSCVEPGLLLLHVQASHCRGLSRCGAQGSVDVARGRGCSTACGAPGLGIEPVSPALAGRFFTTEPLGKPSAHFNF